MQELKSEKPMSEAKRQYLDKYPGDEPIVGGAWGALSGALGGLALISIPKSIMEHRLDDGKKFGVIAKFGEFLSKETMFSKITAGALIGLPIGFLAKLGYDVAKERKTHYEGIMAEREEMRGQLGQAAQMIETVQAENNALKHEVAEGRKKFAEGLKLTAEHGSHVEALKAEGHEQHEKHADAHLADQASADQAELAR